MDNLTLDELFAQLAKSKFRSSFKLRPKELSFLRDNGMDTIQKHAFDFIEKRLAPANPKNDGRQTPMKNHPVFIAQHATATCCRSCLKKWHHIETGRNLTPDQISYIVSIITHWLNIQLTDSTSDSLPQNNSPHLLRAQQ